MPAYRQPLFETEMSRRAVLLDTNVLVAAFWPPDERHKDARAFLDMMEDEVIVPMAVITESWGWLVGSRRSWGDGLQLLTWLNNPGNTILIPQNVENFSHVREITHSMHIDWVDAILSCSANDVSEQYESEDQGRIVR